VVAKSNFRLLNSLNLSRAMQFNESSACVGGTMQWSMYAAMDEIGGQ
jgi:hypothetical protein